MALDSSDEQTALHLVEALGITGRHDDMLSLARRTVEQHPGPASQLILATAFAYRGDPAALEAARRAADNSAGIAREENENIFRDMLQFFDRYEEAEERTRASMQWGSPEWNARRGLSLATALAYQGRRRGGLRALEADPPPDEFLTAFHEARVEYLLGDAAIHEMQASLRWLRDHDPQLRYGRWAAELAYVGQFEAAAAAARTLLPGERDDRMYRAVLRWRRGDPSGAADDLGPLASRGTVDWGVPATWFHAEALAEAGRDEEAIAALQRYQRIYAWPAVHRSWAYPRSLFLLARAHARLGERHDALRHLDQLLFAWRNADPDSPLLRDAVALRAELSRTSRTTEP
jgi:tetratricopeptide (TPR) repeat protein